MDFLKGLSRSLREQNAQTRRIIRSSTIHVSRVGDRSLTPAQKRKVKEERGFKCDKCHMKFDPRFLEVHHKKGIAKHKNPFGDLPIYTTGKKAKLSYDRKSNLQVLCLKCHDKTKKKRKVSKPLWQQY